MIILFFIIAGILFSNGMGISPLGGIIIGLLASFLYKTVNEIKILEERINYQDKLLKELLPQKENELEIEEVEEFIASKEFEDKKEPEEAIKEFEEIKEVKEEKRELDIGYYFNYIKELIIGENPLVRVGAIVLFLGLSFFAKILIDNNLITIEMRLLFIALVGFGITLLGWKLRKKGEYGVILQGLGVATMYLVIFASAKIYALIALKLAFVLMLIVVLIAIALSLLQNSLPLILFALIGGFLVPILTSDNSGSHILLFTYYALLNSAILTISYFKSWRVLNLVGFLFTASISYFWGEKNYNDTIFNSTEPFLMLFFVIYLAITLLFSTKTDSKKYIDTTITFGLPFVVFFFQEGMVGDDYLFMAKWSLLITSIYFILTTYLYFQKEFKELFYSFLALTFAFLGVSIGYYFEGSILALVWSLEAIATIWISFRLSSFLTRLVGLITLFLSSFKAIGSLDDKLLISGEIFSNQFFIALIITFTFFVVSLLYDFYKTTLVKYEKHLDIEILMYSFLIYNITIGMESYYYFEYNIDFYLIFTSILALILFIVNKIYIWNNVRLYLSSYFIFGASILIFSEKLTTIHPFDKLGYISIPIFFTISYLVLFDYQKEWKTIFNKFFELIHIYFNEVLHLLMAVLLVFIISLELFYYPKLAIYKQIIWVTPFILTYFIFFTFESFIKEYKRLYKIDFLAISSLTLLIWSLISIPYIHIDYIPFLNSLDLTSLLVIFILYYWIDKSFQANIKLALFSILGTYIILFLSVVLARFVSQYLNISYNEDIFENKLFQMGLSILWISSSLIIMIISNLKKIKALWIGAMIIIAITVLKLFFIDLANSGTIERIVSFIGVGVFILTIGYFFKVPKSK